MKSNKSEFLDFQDFNLYMIFKIFHETSYFQNGNLKKSRENHLNVVT